MNILILTGNGREHALAVAYAKSEKVKKVVMIPGNGLTQNSNTKIKNYPDVAVEDFEKILSICKKEKIDLVDVSQENIIEAGYVDRFRENGIPAFGPSKKASQIEWDKAWAREFMQKYTLPIPHYETFSDTKKAIDYVESFYKKRDSSTSLRVNYKNEMPDQARHDRGGVLFIKAAGLAFGKGAIRAETKEEALDAIASMKRLGKSGKTFLIEECLIGKEISLFAICDGKNYVITKSAQDHKTIYNRNKGPNTGGIGCVSPITSVTPKIIKEFEEKILKPLLSGMEKENRSYTGILYLNGMVTKSGLKIIEFNARWGDPEAEVLISSIQTPYVEIANAVIKKSLDKIKIKFDNKVRVSITACATGYPDDYSHVKGKEIFGIHDMLKVKNISLYGSNILRREKRFFVNGGRVLHVVAEGKNISQARSLAYATMSMLYIEGNNLHYRTDIGWQEMERSVKLKTKSVK